MRTPALVLCGLVLALGLSGCSARSAGTTDPLEQAAQNVQVQASGTTGAIRGIVVDTAIRPVAGVAISIDAKGGTVHTNTSASGAFGFSNLAPGTYFLKTHKAGYQDTQTSTEVTAGQSAPAITKIQVVPDPTTQPSVDLLVFKGFVECSVLFGTPGGGGLFQPCYVPSFGPTPAERVGDENSYTNFTVSGNMTYVETDLVWTPTQAFGQQLYFNTCYDIPPTNYPGSCVEFTGGLSPQVANVTGGNAAQFEKSGTLYFEVATQGVGNAVPANPAGYTDPGGFSFQQDFQAYFILCHHFLPPVGYSFAKDGAPVPPA